MTLSRLNVALVALGLASSAPAQNFTFSTFAGQAGSSGLVDATGGAARFNQPIALAVDSDGTVYVGEVNSATLRKITPAGAVSTLAVLPSGAAGLAVGADRHVFVADAGSHVIRRVTPAGVVSVFAGQPGMAGSADGPATTARFNTPDSLAFDAAGDLFVTDSGNHTLRRITPTGAVSTFAGLAGLNGWIDGTGSAARFNAPAGLVIDGSGTLYVAEANNRLIRKITPVAVVSTLAGHAVMGSGNVDGTGISARFGRPRGIVLDRTGALIVADQSNHTLRRVTTAGVVTTLAGQAAAPGATNGADPRFNLPDGVAVDASGNLYVADSANHTIRRGEFLAPPVISTPPADATVPAGQNATFGVVATAAQTIAYRWQRRAAGEIDFVNLAEGGGYAGIATATLTVTAVTVAMRGDQFRCVLDSGSGSTVTSQAATLAVTSPPAITSVASATFVAGVIGSFTVTANGVPAPTFSVGSGTLPSWATLNSVTGLISGTPPSTAGSPFTFTLSAVNGAGPAATQVFTLQVAPPPVAPAFTVVAAARHVVSNGGTLTLSMSASGTAPLNYQWKRNGFAIPGATTSTLSKTAGPRDAGYYQLTVSNAGGSVTSPPVFVAISYATSQIVVWGLDMAPPAGLTNAVAVAAGSGHALALKADGTVVAWGSNSSGQATVPTGLSDVVAVAAGPTHSLALKADGTVVAWGYNGSGQTSIPSGLTGVMAIAAGDSHSLALKSNGTVVGWGTGSQATPPAGLAGVVGIAAGGSHSLALKADGTVVLWGYYFSSPPSSLGSVIAVAASYYTDVALKSDGTVAVWGISNTSVPAGLTDVVAVAISSSQGVALKADGTVTLWGDSGGSYPFPPNTRSVVAISAGSVRLALRDATNDAAPTIVTSPASVVANLGQRATFSVTANAGTAALNYQWHRNGTAIAGATQASYAVEGVGTDAAGQYHVVVSNGLGSATSAIATLTVNASPVVSATAGGRFPIKVGQSLTLSLASSISAGASVQWRRNGVPIPGATSRNHAIVSALPIDSGYYQAIYDEGGGPVTSAAVFVSVVPPQTQVLAVTSFSSAYNESNVPAGLNNVTAIAARASSGLALRTDGTVVQWGSSSYYGPPSGLANVVAIATGGSYFLALKADGSVTMWGDTYYTGSVPVGLSSIVAIAAGNSHSLALRSDGTVAAWGSSSYGATAVPNELTNVVAVAAGEGFSLALRANGTVVAWGSNGVGQTSVPAALGSVTAIAAGRTFSVALKSDGTVVTWGSNGSSTNPISPPAGLANVVAIAAGDGHVLATKSDGSAVVWGSYSNGGVLPIGARQIFGAAGGNSASLLLRDSSADAQPVISAQPAPIAAFAAQTVTFGVTASGGTSQLSYQWRKDGVAVPGATAATLVLRNITIDHAGNYDVVVSNYLGAVGSQQAALTVNAATAVRTSPTGRQSVGAGQNLTLTSTLAMPGPVTYQWLFNGQPISGATGASYTITNATWRRGGYYQVTATNAVGPAASVPVFLSVRANVQLKFWGDGTYGQSTPPAGLTDIVHVAAGGSHSLALKSDGTVAAWGLNTSGQCDVPSDLGDVAAIAAGYNFSVALTASGSVRTWGAINFTPSQVRNAVAIAASSPLLTYGSYAVAVRGDGTVVEWDTFTVREVAGVSEVVAVAAGQNSRVGLQRDGKVTQWGSSISPPPSNAIDIVLVSAGNFHNLALKADGTVLAWGSNSYGQASVPVGLTGVASIVAAGDTSYAITSDGTVVSWGFGVSALAAGALGLTPGLEMSFGTAHALGLRDPSTDAAPVIATQPAAQTANAGQTVTFSVSATAIPPPTYQWFKNGVAIAGATASRLTLNTVSASSAGNYSVTVSNGIGSITSNEAILTITPTLEQGGLLGGSAHAHTGAALILGTFTVEGSVAKQVLVRAVGPGLAAFGVAGALSDPQLEVVSSGGVAMASNDDWGSAANSTQIQSAALKVGAFALGAGSKDAAVLRTYSPGTYHVRVTGAGNGAGVAMLDIYDVDSSPRLVYVATSAFAGTGADAFVQGFVLAGVTSGRSYLVRALGPSLGAAGALADPELLVFNSANVQVATNDDWGGDATLVSMAANVGAMPLAAGSKDAAFKFEPSAGGVHTVHVRGVGGGTGRVLLEIFEVDVLRAGSIAPAVVVPPQARSVVAGQSVDFGVVAIGRPAPTYQWRKDGVPIANATNAVLTLASAQPADAGNYSVQVSNGSGVLASPAAALSFTTHAGTHAVVGHGYVAGGTVRITNTLTYAGSAASLGWQVTLPAGWSYASGSGSEADVKPAVGATGTLAWAWSSPPPSPVTFSYTLEVPAGESATRTLAASAILRAGTDPQTTTATPAVLSVVASPLVHSSDTRGASAGSPPDRRIDLFELTRVIELYNTRNGTVRTGCYDVQSGTEDGFAPAPARADGAAAALAAYHSADSNRDGSLSLFELTRVIELYNYRSGSTRTGQYRVQGGTEDGFAPGP